MTRQFVNVMILLLLASAVPAQAQQTGTVYAQTAANPRTADVRPPLLEQGKYQGNWATNAGGKGTLYLTVISAGETASGTFYLASGFPAAGFNEDVSFTATVDGDSIVVQGANGFKLTLQRAGKGYDGSIHAGRGGTINNLVKTR
jgi:hypothetical protein